MKAKEYIIAMQNSHRRRMKIHDSAISPCDKTAKFVQSISLSSHKWTNLDKISRNTDKNYLSYGVSYEPHHHHRRAELVNQGFSVLSSSSRVGDGFGHASILFMCSWIMLGLSIPMGLFPRPLLFLFFMMMILWTINSNYIFSTNSYINNLIYYLRKSMNVRFLKLLN